MTTGAAVIHSQGRLAAPLPRRELAGSPSCSVRSAWVVISPTLGEGDAAGLAERDAVARQAIPLNDALHHAPELAHTSVAAGLGIESLEPDPELLLLADVLASDTIEGPLESALDGEVGRVNGQHPALF